MDEQLYNQLVTVNDKLMSIASLVDSNDIEAFVTVYTAMSDIIDQINDRIPENVKALYATVIKYATKENLKGLASSLKYMRTSEAGFDLFEITDNGSAGVSIKKVTMFLPLKSISSDNCIFSLLILILYHILAKNARTFLSYSSENGMIGKTGGGDSCRMPEERRPSIARYASRYGK